MEISYSPKTARLRILQVSADYFEHPISDKTMRETLPKYALELPIAAVRREMAYLASPQAEGVGPALTLAKNDEHDMWSVRITPTGVDIITGAAKVDGVRETSPYESGLAVKKDLRRGILSFLHDRLNYLVEDVDLLDMFARDGFGALELGELQSHLWYLEGKKYVELRRIRIGDAYNCAAKITAQGANVLAGDSYDVGVTAHAHN